MSYKVVHYINQFFANIGGEEMAHVAPELREGFVGPGMALNSAWKGEAEIAATIVCVIFRASFAMTGAALRMPAALLAVATMRILFFRSAPGGQAQRQALHHRVSHALL